MDQIRFRVIGAHADGTFFNIGVQAPDGMAAFGAAALELRIAKEEGDAQFFAAVLEGSTFELPGDGVVSLSTVLDPEQADVFGYSAQLTEAAEAALNALSYEQAEALLDEHCGVGCNDEHGLEGILDEIRIAVMRGDISEPDLIEGNF